MNEIAIARVFKSYPLPGSESQVRAIMRRQPHLLDASPPPVVPQHPLPCVEDRERLLDRIGVPLVDAGAQDRIGRMTPPVGDSVAGAGDADLREEGEDTSESRMADTVEVLRSAGRPSRHFTRRNVPGTDDPGQPTFAWSPGQRNQPRYPQRTLRSGVVASTGGVAAIASSPMANVSQAATSTNGFRSTRLDMVRILDASKRRRRAIGERPPRDDLILDGLPALYHELDPLRRSTPTTRPAAPEADGSIATGRQPASEGSPSRLRSSASSSRRRGSSS